jgi:hypothetical protein
MLRTPSCIACPCGGRGGYGGGHACPRQQREQNKKPAGGGLLQQAVHIPLGVCASIAVGGALNFEKCAKNAPRPYAGVKHICTLRRKCEIYLH